MTSAQRFMKRASIIAVALGFLLAISGVWYLFAAPGGNCFDGKRNQDEQGVDCGGTCARACEVVFSREELAVREAVFVPGSASGEYDVMARIHNPNDELGAPVLPYVFQLRGASGEVLSEVSGSGFILPQESKTFLAIGLKSDIVPSSVSVVFPETKWEIFSGYQEKPPISILNKRYDRVSSGPFFGEVQGTLVNESLYDFQTILVKVVLRDASGMPVAFNQTEMNTVRTRETRDFRLRWPRAFPGDVAQVDIEPEADVYHEENFVRQYVEEGRFQDLR